jgi:hypothetical protein
MYYLERACHQQVKALGAGRDKVLIAPESAQDEVLRQTGGGRTNRARSETVNAGMGSLLWPACLRRLDREFPGYDA